MKTQIKIEGSRSLRLPRGYRELCANYLPRPLHDDSDYEQAQEAIRPMVGFEARLNADQTDYLEAVSTFIEQFEREQVRWPKSSPEDRLRFLLNEHGMSGAALARLLRIDESMGSKILRGDRQLTVAHIRLLSNHFSVSPGLFLG